MVRGEALIGDQTAVISNTRSPNKKERKGTKKILNPHEAISRRFCGHCTAGQTMLLISFHSPLLVITHLYWKIHFPKCSKKLSFEDQRIIFCYLEISKW